ncbi:MAG: hypothetical protein AB7D37_05690 [Desulfovibrio sp.]
MKIVIPRDITLISTNVAENDAQEWDGDTTYAAGVTVMVTADHRIYKSLRETTGENPADHLVGSDSAWSDKGATNAYKMLDEYINTTTSAEELLDVTISVARCDAVGLFGCRGKTLTIDVISGGTIIYTRTWTLLKKVYTYTEYFFSDPVFVRDVFTAIPIRGASTMRIRIDAGAGGTAQCGIVVTGMSAYLGETQWDVTPSRVSYSKIITDDYGNTSLSKGRLAKYLKFKARINTKEIDYIQKRLDDIDGIACIFVAYSETGYQPEALLVYGYAKEVEPNLPNSELSTVQFEVEGLV